jgi:hypothetical protein
MPASELAALTPSQSFVIFGADPERYAGGGVSSAGDVNGDGFDALIVGEPRTGYTNSPGEAYVVFGGDFLGDRLCRDAGGERIHWNSSARVLHRRSGRHRAGKESRMPSCLAPGFPQNAWGIMIGSGIICRCNDGVERGQSRPLPERGSLAAAMLRANSTRFEALRGCAHELAIEWLRSH